MSRRLITTITPTTSTTTASYTYTGVGAGEVDLVAEITTDEGTVVSNTYSVWDTIFSDVATNTSNKNNYWYKSNVSETTNENGTLLSETENGASYLISTVENTTTWGNRRFLDSDYCVEFDCDNTSGAIFVFYCTGVTGAKTKHLEDGHYKFLVTSTGITGYKNGVAFQNPVYTGALTTVNCGFNDAGSSTTMTIRYKNFKIYPI